MQESKCEGISGIRHLTGPATFFFWNKRTTKAKKEEGEEERGEDGGFSRDPLIGGAPIPLVPPVSF